MKRRDLLRGGSLVLCLRATDLAFGASIVAVRIWPRTMRILMISCMETPSACEKSRTVTPDSTTAGPVGA